MMSTSIFIYIYIYIYIYCRSDGEIPIAAAAKIGCQSPRIPDGSKGLDAPADMSRLVNTHG